MDEHYNPVVVDSGAVVLANYADHAAPAAAVRGHGNWQSLFVAAPFLPRQTIADIAQYADAWCVTPPGTVAAVGENFLMLHALEAGTVPVTLETPAVLTPWGELSTEGEPALKHTVELTAGQTALYRLHFPANE